MMARCYQHPPTKLFPSRAKHDGTEFVGDGRSTIARYKDGDTLIEILVGLRICVAEAQTSELQVIGQTSSSSLFIPP